jgi:hypothetical protein
VSGIPLKVAVAKIDWRQRNVEVGVVSDDKKWDTDILFLAGVGTAFLVAAMAYILSSIFGFGRDYWYRRIEESMKLRLEMDQRDVQRSEEMRAKIKELMDELVVVRKKPTR